MVGVVYSTSDEGVVVPLEGLLASLLDSVLLDPSSEDDSPSDSLSSADSDSSSVGSVDSSSVSDSFEVPDSSSVSSVEASSPVSVSVSVADASSDESGKTDSVVEDVSPGFPLHEQLPQPMAETTSNMESTPMITTGASAFFLRSLGSMPVTLLPCRRRYTCGLSCKRRRDGQ